VTNNASSATEQAEEQHFAPEPGLVRVFLFSHLPLFGRTDPTDKGGEGHGTRVLIVDDHPLTRGALAALLGQNDFSVAGEAASGEEAIEVARELQPDLVLLDLSMPGIGGLGALPLPTRRGTGL
jgi:hypothetical protein